MLHNEIPNPKEIRRAILKSYERCQRRNFRINSFRARDRIQLTEQELEVRRDSNQAWLNVAATHIEDMYDYSTGAGYTISLIDNEGYILKVIGDKALVDNLHNINGRPGSRWTEEDVGTSSISLALAEKIPIQLEDEDHYISNLCHRTCSASPIIDESGRLIGVLNLSGVDTKAHIHTLGMVVSSTKVIENQLRTILTAKELYVQHEIMTAFSESLDRGAIVVDRNGRVTHLNDLGRHILGLTRNLKNQQLADFMDVQVFSNRLLNKNKGRDEGEILVRSAGRTIRLLNTAKPIIDAEGRTQGMLFIFDKTRRKVKRAKDTAGSNAKYTFKDIIGCSNALRETKQLALTAAAGNSSVLLLGETGTGKELFAQAIHNMSDRRGKPFVPINCGAIPSDLLESELFGYIGGAFTGARKGGRPGKFELASGGTVFLDEIGDMPTDMQVKLLRVLQAGEVNRVGQHNPIAVDLRIIAATHTELERAMVQGTFREDLFYRLNVFPILIPPLRDRLEDALLLADYFLLRCCRIMAKGELAFSSEAKSLISNYHWPGNVRELENVIERAVNLADGKLITPDHLAPLARGKRRVVSMYQKGCLLTDIERQTIKETLAAVDNNITRASELLGITRTTLYNKIKRYGLKAH